MVNISLESGHFPSAWKRLWFDQFLRRMVVTLFYWPVSNLSFISKATNRAVFLQIDNHMKKHDLYPSLQSAYRNNHCTETALLKVTNNTLMEMNSQHAVLLVLLDLSAAFDTVDHSVLLHRLVWFKSFLSARSQRVSIPGALSDSLPLDWGVPQGSCLGPLLYIIYSSKLFNIIECHPPNSHCYADDSQIYLSFKPVDLSIETVMMKSSVVRNLGSYIDDKLSMNSYINKVCNASFYYLHNIRRIRKHLSRDPSKTAD